MLDAIHSGSIELRKLAGAASTVAHTGGKAVRAVGKAAKWVVKHPKTGLAVGLSVGAVPGILKRWSTEVSKASPYNPENIYPTSFWRRK